jgi:hypothetical protein
MVGTNGSAAYAGDTGVAIALMRNRSSPDFTPIIATTPSLPRRIRHPTPNQGVLDDNAEH